MIDFRTNKIDQTFPERVGENAKRLQDFLSQVNWRQFVKYAVWIHVGFLLFLFTTIAVVRLALKI